MIKKLNLFLFLALFFSSLVSPLAACAQFKFKGQGFNIESADNSFQIKFDKFYASKVFKLEAPARIVIDIDNFKQSKNINLEPKLKIISKIRIGVHPEKIRIVLDLDSSSVPNYDLQTSQATDALNISINFDQTTQAANSPSLANKTSLTQPVEIIHAQKVAQNQEAENAIIKAPIHIAKIPTQSLKDLEQTHKIEQPTLIQEQSDSTINQEANDLDSTPTTQAIEPDYKIDNALIQNTEEVVSLIAQPKATPKPEAQIKESKSTKIQTSNSQQVITAVKFDYYLANKTPVIIISTKNRPLFELKRKDQHSFVLEIANATLIDGYLSLVQYPPNDFKGITFMKPEKTNLGIEILIGVEEGVRLASYAKGYEILVKALNY